MVEFDTTFCRYRLGWQPEPVAQELQPGRSEWKPCIPDFRMVFPADAEVVDLLAGVPPNKAEVFRRAVQQFRAELPGNMVAAVERFHDGQWAMLMLMHRCPQALDLAKVSPALMYCLANSDQFRGTLPQMAAIQALFRSHQRQRTILEWLGFPGTESMTRIMRKITPECVNASCMRALRRAVEKHAVIGELLAHVPKIPEGVLSLVIYGVFHPMLTPKLLAEVAGADEEQSAAPTATRLEKVLAVLKEITPSQPVRPFESREQVRRYHDAVVLEHEVELQRRRMEADALEQDRDRRRRANARRRQREQQQRLAEGAPPARAREGRVAAAQQPMAIPVGLANVLQRLTRDDIRRMRRHTFPPPPFPGTETILPITSVQGLREEGTAMVHCAGTYDIPVLAGMAYVYKVLHPQRATLSLIRSGTRWMIEQVKGHKNADVSQYTMRSVREWLTGVQGNSS